MLFDKGAATHARVGATERCDDGRDWPAQPKSSKRERCSERRAKSQLLRLQTAMSVVLTRAHTGARLSGDNAQESVFSGGAEERWRRSLSLSERTIDEKVLRQEEKKPRKQQVSCFHSSSSSSSRVEDKAPLSLFPAQGPSFLEFSLSRPSGHLRTFPCSLRGLCARKRRKALVFLSKETPIST